MAVLPAIAEFLAQVKELQEAQVRAGIKFNPTDIRQAFASMTDFFVANAHYKLKTIDDSIDIKNHESKNDSAINSKIPLRIYAPEENLPVAVFIHGGGHMSGSIAVYDNVLQRMAVITNHIIIAIDYRLAPEYPYPTAINDCKSVIAAIPNILKNHCLNPLRAGLTIIGDSAGGAVTATINADQDFVKENNIIKQVLIYPSLDYTASSNSYKQFGTGYLLETAKINWYFENYFRHNDDRKLASPLFMPFYRKMPATLIIASGNDPLLDDSINYQQQLLNSGNHAQLIIIDGVIHAFLMLENLCKDECFKTYSYINEFLAG